MINYADMLMGRPFQVQPFRNPYEDLFANFYSLADAFKRQGAEIDQHGTLAQPGQSRGGQGFNASREYRRPEAPKPQTFGGLG